jgi:hypothetical protein
MYLKITKETKYNQQSFYYITCDAKYIAGSSDLEKINKMYEDIINDPSIIETKVETIKKTEI